MNRLRNDLRKQRAAKRDANRVVHAHVGRSVGESSVALLDMLAAPGTTPSRAVSRAEAEAAVRAAIDALPEQYRRAVWMVYIEGRSVSEVAEKLGRTKRSIHGLCRRGLAELRNHLASATNYLSSGG